MSRPNVGQTKFTEIKGMALKMRYLYDWGKIGGEYGFEWVPVVNKELIIVDIVEPSDAALLKTSFWHKLPIVWDGYIEAYRAIY